MKFLLVTTAFLILSSKHPAPVVPVNIGSRLELFIDSALIEQFNNVSLRLHHPVRSEVVMNYDKPWEGNGCSFRTVFKDGDKYRMYYTSWHAGTKEDSLSHPEMIAYAESKDGIHWLRPHLGLVSFKGSTKNNIILSQVNGGPMLDFSVIKDPNPSAFPEAKYKAVGLGRKPLGIYIFQSPDGIHWKTVQNTPVFTDPYKGIGNIGDAQNIIFWDAVQRIYRMYFRARRDGRRDILTATSKDFIHWSEPEWLSYPNAPQEQLYTNNIQPYYRAPHIYMGFPVRYIDHGITASTWQLPEPDLRRQRIKRSVRYGTAVTDALFMVSRDGKTFYRYPEAFISPGLRTSQNWSYGDNYLAWHLVETKSAFDDAPNELSLYATEGYFTGNACRLRRYTMRIDGFVSACASINGGDMTTRPLTFSGKALTLNYATSAGGHILVELQDAYGVPIAGFTSEDCDIIYGDQLQRQVSWNGKTDVSLLAGKPVRIKFLLSDANLYSMKFTDQLP